MRERERLVDKRDSRSAARTNNYIKGTYRGGDGCLRSVFAFFDSGDEESAKSAFARLRFHLAAFDEPVYSVFRPVSRPYTVSQLPQIIGDYAAPEDK